MAVFQIAALIIASLGVQQQRQARKEQREASKIESRIGEVKARRERVRQVQEQRILQARVASQASAGGTETTSSTQGVQASLQSQLGANLSFLDQTQEATRQISRRLQTAADFQSNASSAFAISSSLSQTQGTGIFG